MTAITLTHKIRLSPTQAQERYFVKACGVARFTWNWALSRWKDQYDHGKKPTGLGLKKEFAFRKKKAAQYGSNFDKAILKLAKKNGFKYKKEYLDYLLK